ncbi:MAG: 1,4-alpha-glucan branching protein GlgB [Desulfotomaculaceae bacterium]|nr:1,4-alpha-glucan branching protein GlgB [Desulfotomaculaceae bacterium]
MEINKFKNLTQQEIYLFNQGELFQSYRHFGAHLIRLQGIEGVSFAVWAPHAYKVSVVGAFNNWQIETHPMENYLDSGVWVTFIKGLKSGEPYKYCIETKGGQVFYKADPFAFYAELRPHTASRVFPLEGHSWRDEAWIASRKQRNLKREPLLIYEVHLGTWRKRADGDFMDYREIADLLIPYVKKKGFTHLELLPVTEHPFDGSWGYQVTGFFAATSRYGNPHELMHLIDRCHQEEIGVIMDWVPGHFCRDVHGLGQFDGTPLYEEGNHEQWGTYRFNFNKTEIWSFLISNAFFWFEQYHIDGLRVDGVSSMLYLDFGKENGDWIPNRYGGRENLAAVEFLRKLNQQVFKYFPGVIMVAEEATDWPFVTRPPYDGGLGFSYKWNMGWMNDTLKYFSLDFEQRQYNHNLLTFSLVYSFSEDFILPFSHDEVVHGKKSLINKMPGDYWQKFAGQRVLYLYLICHPGKKLLFMGGEFAQFIEWKQDAQLDWFLKDYDMHRMFAAYVKELNNFYLNEKSLWAEDHGWEGFEWIDVNDHTQSILVFQRRTADSSKFLVIALNLLPQAYPVFRIGMPQLGTYKIVLNTDSTKYGGSGFTKQETLLAEEVAWHNSNYSVVLQMPPLGGLILECAGATKDQDV